jgi:hypothetical protein
MEPLPMPRRVRRRRISEQLSLWNRPEDEARGRPDLIPTSVLRRHRSCARVLELIRQVRLFFPELDGLTLKVGLTRTAAGLAAREEPWIWVNPRKLSRHTIAHELVHLLQARDFVPSGEKSADLFALARHPHLVDDLPYYLRLPRSFRMAVAGQPESAATMLYRLACDSLVQREAGHRHYLRWFERTLEDRWSACRQAEEASIPMAEPCQMSFFH